MNSNNTKKIPLSSIKLISGLWIIIGFFLSICGASLILFDSPKQILLEPILYHILVLGLSYTITVISMRSMRRFPYVHVGKMAMFFLFIFSALGYGTLAPFYFLPVFYYIFFVIGGFFILLAWDRFKTRFQEKHLLVIPGGISDDLLTLSGAKEFRFKRKESYNPVPSPHSSDGIVVDSMHPYPTEWIRFISSCKLHKIPVYQAENLYESITGKTSLKHLSQGLLENFNINPVYALSKRCIDILLILITFPITGFLMVFVALAIRLESKGPILFTQKRIGEAGKEFTIYKFRSMYIDSEINGPQFAGEKDLRVTKVGAFIRKFRLDELPQFWNILKGEMSLIGPRPEQTSFVRDFEKEIPFYGYRHLVKPGISGWAQVTQGYTSNSMETEEKVQYDLFYIKHFSFWLDMIIAVKTLKTIATGFGAR